MQGRNRSRGVTLPELLVVITIIGLAVAVAVPAMTDSIRGVRLRSAARQLEATLRAARIVAVTMQQDTQVHITPAPAAPAVPTATENIYRYTDLENRERIGRMPIGVRIISSTTPVTFLPNGTLAAEALTVLEVESRQGPVTWQLITSRMGMTRVIGP